MPEASPTEGEANFYRSTLSALKWFAPKRWREVSLDAQALTFSTLLALVPTLTLLFGLFSTSVGFFIYATISKPSSWSFSVRPRRSVRSLVASWSRPRNISSEALLDLSLSSYLVTRSSR